MFRKERFYIMPSWESDDNCTVIISFGHCTVSILVTVLYVIIEKGHQKPYLIYLLIRSSKVLLKVLKLERLVKSAHLWLSLRECQSVNALNVPG